LFSNSLQLSRTSTIGPLGLNDSAFSRCLVSRYLCGCIEAALPTDNFLDPSYPHVSAILGSLAVINAVSGRPEIGRKLPGLLAAAGFKNIDLELITRPDLDERLLPMVRNMASYARDSGLMDTKSINDALPMLEEALAENSYLVLATQFVIAAER
jgi:hypothetical protein